MVVGEIPDKVDLLVVGAGPGGYAAALRGAQLGREVTLVSSAGVADLGGVCLHVGCVPSKALIECARLAHSFPTLATRGLFVEAEPIDLGVFQDWKHGIIKRLASGVASLLDRAAIVIIGGRFTFTRPDQGVIETLDGQAHFVQFNDVVIATGSRPGELVELPVDHVEILDSTDILSLTDLPPSIAVIGAGYIGIELGTALAKLGSRVTILEAAPRILPALDAALGAAVERRLRALGVAVHCDIRLVDRDDSTLVVAHDGQQIRIDASRVLVATGRRPNTDDLGLERLGVSATNGGHLAVDAARLVKPHVGAIGDVTPGHALAHKAYAEASIVVEALCGRRVAFDPRAIPAVVFGDPEIASAGMTKAVATEADIAVGTWRFSTAASPRALIDDAGAGFVEVIAAKGTGQVLGVHIAGAHASELIAEGVLAIEMGSTLTDLALAIHAHPTFAESYGELGRLGAGFALHGRSSSPS